MQTNASLRVLVVEDETDLGENLCAWLQIQGHEVSLAQDVETATNILEQAPDLDVVLSDVYLADEGGGASCERPGGLVIAEVCDRRTPPIPVLLLTGRPSLDAALEGLRQQACDFLTKPVAFSELHHRMLQAVERRRLRQQVAELQEVTRVLSRALPNAIEAKDPSTRGHSDRVAEYADTLGRRCGLTEADLADLRLASMLHDVGKIGVPEAILTKEGPLTRDERTEIEKHPAIGLHILEPLRHMPNVQAWVYQHHERWDGTGYPERLHGDDVALPGRILILAEVFDALATARSYKKAWPTTRIADFFDKDRGSHFDPELSRIVADGVRRDGIGFFRPGPAPQGPSA